MRCPKKSSVVAALLWVAVILLGANAALADLEVSFVVPSLGDCWSHISYNR